MQVRHFGGSLLLSVAGAACLVAGAGVGDPASRPAASRGSEAVFSVRDFGALGDGRTRDTRAIQGAIDAAAKAGGGTVSFGPGRYLSGTLFLKSHVALRLARGAVLLGSTNLADYPPTIPKIRSYTDNYVRQSLIYGEGLEDVAITGSGAIDGQGAAFKTKAYLRRPYVIRLVSCRHVLIEGITLRNSAMWMQHYLACEYVTIRGIRVLNHSNYNNDMVDIDGCRNVHITGCTADSADDAVTLKSTFERPCENVVISDCVLYSNCNAIKMGTESNGGFRNIAISNCTIGPQRDERGFFGRRGLAGIALMIVDGGTLDRVTISNIAMTGVRVPIFIRLGNRARPFRKDMERPGIGRVRNIAIRGIVARPIEPIGCSITGLPGHPVENVVLSAIRITFPGGGKRREGPVPEKPASYPESTMFGALPAYGFYCRHVAGLTLRDIDVGWEAKDLRPALVCDDVRDLRVDGFRGQCAADGAPMIVLRDVRDALIRGCQVPRDAAGFLRLEGGSNRIGAVGNDVGGAAKAFEFAEGVDPSVLFREANRERP